MTATARISFQGNEYLFVGDLLEHGGAIATEGDYMNGRCSYAHLLVDGRVMRFNHQIGNREDIKVLEHCETPMPSNVLRAILNMFTHPSWEEGAE